MNRAYLALGSNIRPEHCLPAAARLLAGHGAILKASRVYQSPPFGFERQPDFLNAALLLETERSAVELCEQVVKEVESSLGRVRDPNNRNAPRTIDVDLALFNRERLHVGSRVIPDPDILERWFLAVPLADLEPEYVHPVTGETLAAIAGRLLEGASPLLRDDLVL